MAKVKFEVRTAFTEQVDAIFFPLVVRLSRTPLAIEPSEMDRFFSTIGYQPDDPQVWLDMVSGKLASSQFFVNYRMDLSIGERVLVCHPYVTFSRGRAFDQEGIRAEFLQGLQAAWVEGGPCVAWPINWMQALPQIEDVTQRIKRNAEHVSQQLIDVKGDLSLHVITQPRFEGYVASRLLPKH